MTQAQNDKTGIFHRISPLPRLVRPSRRCAIAGRIAAILAITVAASVAAGSAGAATVRACRKMNDGSHQRPEATVNSQLLSHVQA